MNIAMNDARYEYRPRHPAVVQRQREAARERMGIPPGHVRLWGVHVPEDRAKTMRAYAGWIRQKEGVEAAVAFLEAARANGWKAKKPSPARVEKTGPRYLYRPWASTVRKNIWEANRGNLSLRDGTVRIFDIFVPEERAQNVRPWAIAACRAGGKRAAQWFLLRAQKEGWGPAPDLQACAMIGYLARGIKRSIARAAARQTALAIRAIQRLARGVKRSVEWARAQPLRAIQAFAKWAMRWPRWLPKMLRVIQSFARLALDPLLFIRAARVVYRLARLSMRRRPKPRIDWSLLDELRDEHMTVAEIAAFAGVQEGYARRKLRDRAAYGC